MEKEHEHKNTDKSVFSYLLIIYELQINILDEEIKTIARSMTFGNQSLKNRLFNKKKLKKKDYTAKYTNIKIIWWKSNERIKLKILNLK